MVQSNCDSCPSVSHGYMGFFLSKKETGIKGISNSDYTNLEYTDLDLNISDIYEKVLI